MYRAIFDGASQRISVLLESTQYLQHSRKLADEVQSNPELLEMVRYLAGPPISRDDLATITNSTLSPRGLQADPEAAERLVETVLESIDNGRFPWMPEGRPPNKTELAASVVATACLIATQRVQTLRRTMESEAQEQAVVTCLGRIGLVEAPARRIETYADAPEAGSFTRECLFGGRKADLVVHLGDGRLMPVECKVSNSATNSVKRLNNDAVVKSRAWMEHFGKGQCVPSAVLSGVFKLVNLQQAQRDGLALYWAHDLEPLQQFILAASAVGS